MLVVLWLPSLTHLLVRVADAKWSWDIVSGYMLRRLLFALPQQCRKHCSVGDLCEQIIKLTDLSRISFLLKPGLYQSYTASHLSDTRHISSFSPFFSLSVHLVSLVDKRSSRKSVPP
jgi:hypothetical protein